MKTVSCLIIASTTAASYIRSEHGCRYEQLGSIPVGLSQNTTECKQL